jgi:outer membrane protein OmpA-like peptidoglycan-associated protein
MRAQVPLFPDSGGVRISDMQFNTRDAEFSPVEFEDELYFVSDRPWHYGVINLSEGEGKQFADIYSCRKKDTTRCSKPKNLLHPVNSVFNEGPFCFTPRGIYLTTNNSTAKVARNKSLPLQISFSDRNSDKKFARPKRISFEMADTISFGHPFVIGDSLMYLVSDMAGGFGSTDIYYSRFVNGTWQKPVNCGERINTAYNEEFPCYADGKIYFSSDRTGGFGKLDIYCAERSGNEFLFPGIVSPPINSAADDFGIFIAKDKRSGYLSSNRKGNDDVFYFSINPAQNFSNCVDLKFNEYCYTFFEESAKTNTDTAGVYYEWDLGDETKERGPEVYHCFDGEGKFLVELNVVDKSSGEIFYNQLTYEMEIRNIDQLYIDVPDSVMEGKKVSFNARYSKIKGYVIEKYFWDFGDGKYSAEEFPEHVFLKDGVYEVKLKTSGKLKGREEDHCITRKLIVLPLSYKGSISIGRKIPRTWDKTTAKRKKALDSLFRSDPELLNFLKTKIRETETANDSARFIDPLSGNLELNKGSAHLTSKDPGITYRIHLGTSETPLKPNDPFFKGLDSVTEVKTLRLYQYFYGKYKSPEKALRAVKKLKELGFSPFVFSFDKDSLEYNPNPRVLKKLFPDTIKPLLPKNTELETAYFEFNDFNLTPDEKVTISALAAKYCKTKSEFLLSGYSDNQGGPDYNLALCKKRLNSVKEILVANGVKEKYIKINPIGAVKTSLADDSEITRRHNRRVEILVKIKK